VLFDGSNTLLQPFHTFLNLAIGEVDKCACFSELLFKEGLIFDTPLVEMHLKSFSNKLEFVTESFCQHTSVPLGVSDVSPEAVGRCRDELPDLRE
jgi:hypothetical protein